MLTRQRLLLYGLSALLLLAVAVAACSQPEPPAALPADSAESASIDSNSSDSAEADTPSVETPSQESSGSAAIAIAEAKAASADASTDSSSPTLAPTLAREAARGATETPGTADINQVVATDSPPPVLDTLVQLIDPLDEPEFYCVDVPGFRDSLRTDRPLQAHTCKPGADDELFQYNQPAEGQLYMEAYDLCVEAEADLAYTRPCTGSSAQEFAFRADGTIRTEDGGLCLSVAPGDGEPAGGRSHVRRDLRFVSCAEGERVLSRWALPGTSPSSEPVPSTKLMNAALDSALSGDPWEIEKMGSSGDRSYIPVLVELMRFPWWHINREIDEAIFGSLDQIAAQNPDIAEVDAQPPQDEWFRWVVWIGKHPEVWPPPGFAGWKGRLYGDLVDPAMGAFLYEGVPSNIRIEEIVWGGVRKDGIPDLTDAPVIDGADASYLDPEDRVFGVSFNGENRAYPHRIVNAHEMANDVVGGVPFALTY